MTDTAEREAFDKWFSRGCYGSHNESMAWIAWLDAIAYARAALPARAPEGLALLSASPPPPEGSMQEMHTAQGGEPSFQKAQGSVEPLASPAPGPAEPRGCPTPGACSCPPPGPAEPVVKALESEPSAVAMARKAGVIATQPLREAMQMRRERDPSLAKHPDDIAVDSFARAMSDKLASKRALGYSGWGDKDRCSAQHLSDLLRSHVEKGDPVDVANFAMMLHQRGERILSALTPPAAPAPVAGGELKAVLEQNANLRERLDAMASHADQISYLAKGGALPLRGV